MPDKTQQLENLMPVTNSSRRLRGELMVLLGSVLLVALLVAGGGVLYFTFLTEQQAWQGRQAEAANYAGEKVTAFLQGVEDTLNLVGSMDLAYLEVQPQVMDSLLQRTPAFQEIIRTNSRGQVIGSANQDSPLLANLFIIPQSNWFLTAMRGQLYLGRVEIAMNDEPYLIIAMPAADGGVVAARLNMRVLWDVVADFQFGKSGQAYVINDSGDVVAHINPDVVFASTNLSERPEITAILNAPDKKWSDRYTNFEGNTVVGSTAPIPGTAWVVITELSTAEAFTITQRAIQFLGIGVLLMGIVVMLVAIQIIKRLIFNPLHQLQIGAIHIGQGDFSYQINVVRQDEIGQVATAFNKMNAQLQELYRSLELRTQRLATVAVLTERLNAILNIDELFEEVVNQIKNNFNYYHAQIYLMDEKQEELVLKAGTGAAGAEMKAAGYSISMQAATTLVVQAARTGKIARIDNVQESPDWLPNRLLPHTLAEMAVPIVLNQKVMGVLNVQKDEVAGLNEGDANLLRSLANAVAITIRNARLFAEVEATLQDLREAQQRYVEQGWQKSKVLGKARHLYSPPHINIVEKEQLQLAAEARRLALAQKRPMVVETENDNQRKSLVAPINLRDKTIGVLKIQTKDIDQKTWNEDDISLIQAIIDQVAQTAESLRLFEDIRGRAGQEQTIREITDKLRRASTFELLVKTASEELGKVLDVSHSVVKIGGPEPKPEPKPEA